MAAGDAATLSSANAHTDAREAMVRTDMATGDAATLSAANTHTDARETVIRTDMAAGDAATLASANAHTAVREGVIRTDMAAADTATLQSARSYADTTATQAIATSRAYTDSVFAAFNDDFNAFRGDVDRRFHQQDRRLDRQGAMASAMLNMASSAAGIQTTNRVGVGVGYQNGEAALAIGYQRSVSPRAAISIGGAFSGDDSSVGVGAGFGW